MSNLLRPHDEHALRIESGNVIPLVVESRGLIFSFSLSAKLQKRV